MAPLPLPQTSFIGRGRELAALQRLLADARLITLTGAPGTGKTRLALELAASAAHRFPDGVCFVSLTAVRDPTVVLGTLARALGVRELPGRPLAAGVRDYLAGKRLLLVLDNFEQVLAAATLVTGLLAACPHLTMLVTSRIVLHVQGEHTFAVPPLTLPNRWRNAPTERILQAEAVQLFVARAQSAQAGAMPTRDDGAVVAELCCRLDGLPLAIELAAARTRPLPPSLLLAGLEQHRPLLGEDAQDLPARQQTLHTAITWSYNLLDDRERALFRRLAVFSGGFTLEAVEGICTDDAIAADEVMHLVHRLLDHSLIVTEEGGGAVRCRLLETLREFAQEQWQAAPEEWATLRRRHRDWYLAVAERLEPHLRERRDGLDALEGDHDNLRAALAFSSRAPEEHAAGLRLAAALGEFWRYRGYLTEGRQWLETAIAAAAPAPPSPILAKARVAAGTLAWTGGDNAAARAHLEAALQAARPVGATPESAAALLGLGTLALRDGAFPEARQQIEEAVRLFRRLGDRLHLTEGLFELGLLAVFEEDYDRADPILNELHAITGQIGDEIGAAYVLSLQGVVRVAQGRLDEAGLMMKQALERLVALNDRWGLPHVLDGFVVLAAAQGQPGSALRLGAASLTLREAIGAPLDPSFVVYRERSLAAVRRASGPGPAAAAWAAGRAMSAEQTIAAALAVATGGLRQPKASHSSATGRRPDELTARENEVARLMARGMSNQQIAGTLVISERTVESHVGNILDKLGLSARTQIVAWVDAHH